MPDESDIAIEAKDTGESFYQFLGNWNRSLLIQETDDELDKQLTRFLKTKDPGKGRKPGLHVSMFSDPCLRRLALIMLKPEIKDPAPPNKLSRIFDCGTATHEWYQERYLGPMGVLIGTWQCSCCGKKVDGAMPTAPCDTVLEDLPWEDKPSTCATRHAHWRFREPYVHFDHAGLSVVGHSDGVINLGGNWSVLEMKTENSELWKSRTKPEAGHVVQGSLYAIKLGVPAVTIVYIEKNEWTLKIYKVPVEAWVLDWFNKIVEQVAAIVQVGDFKAAPLKCSNRSCARATRCGARDLCFPKKVKEEK